MPETVNSATPTVRAKTKAAVFERAAAKVAVLVDILSSPVPVTPTGGLIFHVHGRSPGLWVTAVHSLPRGYPPVALNARSPHTVAGAAVAENQSGFSTFPNIHRKNLAYGHHTKPVWTGLGGEVKAVSDTPETRCAL